MIPFGARRRVLVVFAPFTTSVSSRTESWYFGLGLSLVSLWSLFGLSLVSPWSLLVSPWSLFAPRDAVSFSKIIRRKTKNRRALEFGFAARRKKKNAAVAAVVSFVVPVKKENATKSALRVLCSFISPQVVSSLRASSILTSCVRSRRHFSFVTSSTLRRTTRRARTRSARRDGRVCPWADARDTACGCILL